MRCLSNPTALQALSIAATVALLAGCFGGNSSTIAPKPVTILGFNNGIARHLKSFYACPAKGSIKYVSDYNNNVINVFVGKFAGQSPCGQITSGLINSPAALYVQIATHDLYVANSGNSAAGGNILVFHRGRTTPYNIYTDPTVQDPWDVTVANDGTVIASNEWGPFVGQIGSISTWIEGPNGGTFVGNFPMASNVRGSYLALRMNGTLYYDDFDPSISKGELWTVACPAGVCGVQMKVAGVTFEAPGGMKFDDTGDLLANDQLADTADTFELPNPTPRTFPLVGYPMGMAIDQQNHHWFVTDNRFQDAAEYLYPSGVLVGTVPGFRNGQTLGIAVDP